MKYIVNPFDATTSDCNCNCSSACHCNSGTNVNICSPKGNGSCNVDNCVIKCESKCESKCSNNCTGTNSVASPTSFNF